MTLPYVGAPEIKARWTVLAVRYHSEIGNPGEVQRRELEAIFSGKKGGHLATLWGAVIDDWLPAKIVSVAMSWGEKPILSVNGIGQATMQPISNGAGKSTIVSGAMSQAGLQIESMNLARSDGSQWSDPDFRSWEGSSGNIHEFDWSN